MDNQENNNLNNEIQNTEVNNEIQSTPNTQVEISDISAEELDPQSIIDNSTEQDFSNDPTPLGETLGGEYVDPDVSYYDNQSNSNKSINNPTDVVGNYTQDNSTYIDDSEGISSYEDQINNSQDISLYSQQGSNTQQDMNYDNGYVYNDDMNNYDNGYVYNDDMNNYDYSNQGNYDNGMYNEGYDYNTEFSNPDMYGNGDTVAYNNSGYSDYGNDFDSLNSGGYDMNNPYNNGYNGSYARPNNNNSFVNFAPQQQPEYNEPISTHPKTIGPAAFQKKMRDNNRPFNFMLILIYGIIIAIIGYFAYNLWLDKNSFNFSKDKMNLVLSYNYEEVVYVKGKIDDNANYEWKSSDDDIATVNGNGKITAKSEGTTTIIVKSKKTKKEKKITVNVINPEIKQFTISPNEKVLYVGNTYTITPLINGQSSLTLNMEWDSSNEGVATVENGVVTPKSKGTTKITVMIPKTSHKATMTIIVTEKK